MIVIRVLLEVKPEERAMLLDHLKSSSEISRQFAGCEQFGYFADVTNENRFILYEEWASQADFDAYKASDHFSETGKIIFPNIVGKPDSVYYDATVIETP